MTPSGVAAAAPSGGQLVVLYPDECPRRQFHGAFMGLKFLPRAGHMVPFAAGNARGQLSRFVGRTLKPIAKGGAGAAAYVSDDEAVEVDPDGPDAAHLIRQARKSDPGVWPADEATAAACGVEFVKLARDPDGEWIAAPKAVSAQQAPASVSRKPELKAEL